MINWRLQNNLKYQISRRVHSQMHLSQLTLRNVNPSTLQIPILLTGHLEYSLRCSTSKENSSTNKAPSLISNGLKHKYKYITHYPLMLSLILKQGVINDPLDLLLT